MPCCGGPSDWPAPRYHWQSERQAPAITRGQPWQPCSGRKSGNRRNPKVPAVSEADCRVPTTSRSSCTGLVCHTALFRTPPASGRDGDGEPGGGPRGQTRRCQLGVSSFRCSHPLRRSSSWSLCGGIGTSGPGFRASGWDTLIEVGLENPPCQAARTTARRRTFFGPMKTRVRWPDGERRSLRRARGRSHRLLASMGTGATGQR